MSRVIGYFMDGGLNGLRMIKHLTNEKDLEAKPLGTEDPKTKLLDI